MGGGVHLRIWQREKGQDLQLTLLASGRRLRWQIGEESASGRYLLEVPEHGCAARPLRDQLADALHGDAVPLP